MSNPELKRLFFGFEVLAPWPAKWPKGRVLHEENRHLTMAFLGQTDFSILESLLDIIPKPEFKVGLTGVFNKILFLPKAHPRVVAWNVLWFDRSEVIKDYGSTLIVWLKEKGFHPDEREELIHHVTVCRSPFEYRDWRQAFEKLPLLIKNFNLYESLGQLTYKPIWTFPLKAPFEELDHTADIAFKIYGETVSQLFLHAAIALAFKSPELLKYLPEEVEPADIDDVVIFLNRMISDLDADLGSPFKAVSFHGEIIKEPDNTLSWEMIVDV